MKYLTNFKDNLSLFSSNVKPSSLEEVKNLEERLGVKLPQVLIDFFVLVGGDYDAIWGGGGGDKIETIDYTLNLAKKLLSEVSICLEDYFAFSSYNDDQFLFVYLNEGDDPCVYRFEMELFYCGDEYIPGSSEWGYPKGVMKVADSFSEMIDEIVQSKLNE